jgi:tetratricopeptide (TPR) repeat protein
MLRIVDGVWWFWWIRGEIREARAWTEVGLENAEAVDPDLRARVLLASAGLAWAQADTVSAERDGAAAREQFAALGNRPREASALNTLGLSAHLRGDLDAARTRFEESLAVFRADGEPEGARALSMATTIDNLGSVAREQGDDDYAVQRYEEARAINLRFGEEAVMNELHLAHIAAERGDLANARPLLAGALRWYGERAWLQYVAECLESASITANATGGARMAAVILGASEAMRSQAGAPAVPFVARMRERELAVARKVLGDSEARAAFDEGLALPMDAAISMTLGLLEG